MTQPNKDSVDGTDLVEIARSFSYKLNVGNYETRDFFCSQKQTCLEEDAKKVSKNLFEFCQQQVMNDVEQYCEENEIGQ